MEDSENAWVPASLNCRSTPHSPVVWPVELRTWPALAALRSEPGTVTGPRMYLICPLESHAA